MPAKKKTPAESQNGKLAGEDQRQQIFDVDLAQTPRINNWDLVGASAPCVAARRLLTRPRTILDKLAASPMLGERRIADNAPARDRAVSPGERKRWLGCSRRPRQKRTFSS